MSSLSSLTILLGQSERDYILAGCREDCRLDGRTCRQVRPYVLVQQQQADDPLILSHGSARLLSANTCPDGESTQLLCSVKAELVQPAPHRPNQGAVEFHVDTLAAGIPRRLCDELQATLTHLLGQAVVDTAALCVLPAVYAWRLHIDVYILSHAGSLLDAASRVIRAALDTTKLPAVEVVLPASTTTSHEESNMQSTAEASSPTTPSVMVNGDYHQALGVPGVSQGPVIVTVTVLQSLDASHRPVTSLVLDATAAEEVCATAQVHVSVVVTTTTSNDDGSSTTTTITTPTITAISKTGTGALPVALLPEITKLALQQASKVNDKNDDTYLRKTSSEPTSAWLLQGLYDLQ